MKTEKLTKADLTEFTGTEQWYRHPIAKDTLYTDGIKYLAEKAGAYWLIDEIAFNQKHPSVFNEEFQVWTLSVDLEKSTAILTCDDGNGQIIYTIQIEYTDFPLEEIKTYVTNNVILLPGEYCPDKSCSVSRSSFYDNYANNNGPVETVLANQHSLLLNCIRPIKPYFNRSA